MSDTRNTQSKLPAPTLKMLTWRDVDDIAVDLVGRYPNLDPLTVNFPELKKMIASLPAFGDSLDAASDKTLEAIQAAWYNEYED